MEFFIEYLPLVRGLIPWLALSFTACLIAGFYDTFMERRFLKKRWGGNLLMILALYLLQFGRQRIFNALPTELLYSDMVISLDMLNLCSIYLVIAVVFYKAAMETRIFTAVTQMIICQVSGGIANGRFFRETLRKLTFESGWFIPSAYPIVRFDAFLLLRVVLAEGITLAVEFAVITKVKRMFRGRNVCVRRSELPVLILPSVLYLCWRLVECTYIGEIYYLNQNTVYEYEYEGFLRDYFGSPVIRFVVLGAILCVLKQFRDVISLTGERNSRILLEKQVSSMQEHLKEVERLQEGLRELKHDMKNTFLVASRMAVGEWERKGELDMYLSQLDRRVEDLEPRFKTGNSVADILLNMKYNEAIETIPELNMNAERLFLPETLLIQAYDISVILGNALDNSIEACKKQKEQDPQSKAFIRLSSILKGKIFLLEIQNSFDGSPLETGSSGLPVTRKQDKESHGIGLTNIQSTAARYHGTVRWSAEGKVFTLSVMLKNEMPG